MEKREYFDKWRAYYFHKIRKLLISNDALKISRQLYKPVINKKYDVEQAYNLLVFSSKGIYLTEEDSNFPILLYLDDVYLVDKYSALKHLKMMNFKDVFNPAEYKDFPLGKQRLEIPDINDEIDVYFKSQIKQDFQTLLEDKTSEYVEKNVLIQFQTNWMEMYFDQLFQKGII